jgi:hypothetical protein
MMQNLGRADERLPDQYGADHMLLMAKRGLSGLNALFHRLDVPGPE